MENAGCAILLARTGTGGVAAWSGAVPASSAGGGAPRSNPGVVLVLGTGGDQLVPTHVPLLVSLPAVLVSR